MIQIFQRCKQMAILASLIWIAIGVIYVVYKGFREITGYALLSVVCIVLCVIGISIPVWMLKCTDSITFFFIGAGGAMEVLAWCVSRSEENKGIIPIITICISAIIVLNGIIEMLGEQGIWLLSIVIPFALLMFVCAKKSNRAEA